MSAWNKNAVLEVTGETVRIVVNDVHEVLTIDY